MSAPSWSPSAATDPITVPDLGCGHLPGEPHDAACAYWRGVSDGTYAPPPEMPVTLPRYSMTAPQAVKCPKCNAGFGVGCQSTGGGNGGPVWLHKVRRARVAHWTDEQRRKFAAQVVLYRHAETRPAPEVVDQIAAEAEAAATPLPTPKPMRTNPRAVRLSENQAEEIERFACCGGKAVVSTAHFHGDHQHRQTINALRDRGVLTEGGLINHGYDREYTLTAFGWQVYLNHRLIIRRAEGDRWAASLAGDGAA